MPSPFPGMDPYLESQGHWGDFHYRFVGIACDALQSRLPDDYVARFNERVQLVSDEPPPKTIYPDVALARRDRGGPGGVAVLEDVATIEAVRVGFVRGSHHRRHIWIEIEKLPEQRLVTVIELLSPTNKSGGGRPEYLEKRDEILAREVHLVEIDLLVAGREMPMARAARTRGYRVVVGRTEHRPHGDVYDWSIRRPLPNVPIPLSAPDPDVSLDLAEVVATAYERGRYARLVDYSKPLELPLAPADREWAEGVARGALAQ